MHNINTSDDLWPAEGEWLRYIWSDEIPYKSFDPKLTCNNEYEVRGIRYLPCADAIYIADDNGYAQWVELYKFSFLDAREFYNKGVI